MHEAITKADIVMVYPLVCVKKKGESERLEVNSSCGYRKEQSIESITILPTRADEGILIS